MAQAETVSLPALDAKSKSDHARALLLEGKSVPEVVEETGVSKTQVYRLRAEMKGSSADSGPRPTANQAQAVSSSSSQKTAPVGRNEHEERLARGWQGLWRTIASIWDDDELELSDKEARAWAIPAADTLELLGHLDKTRYVAPGELAGVTIAQVRPRLQRVAMRPMKRTTRRPSFVGPAPEPSFSMPPGMQHQPPPGAPSINGNQAPDGSTVVELNPTMEPLE